eukprot:TRINITY_DN92395_c0_g1_i1.p1 TRINITY_DN92395_c0_g1~~TRINITY_DN92395_c0_g1_i1.p1  ORF type:complete len:333 (+),score=26.17 TRINITY_DN92395_c0_g1_i1:110-1108(+)
MSSITGYSDCPVDDDTALEIARALAEESYLEECIERSKVASVPAEQRTAQQGPNLLGHGIRQHGYEILRQSPPRDSPGPATCSRADANSTRDCLGGLGDESLALAIQLQEDATNNDGALAAALSALEDSSDPSRVGTRKRFGQFEVGGRGQSSLRHHNIVGIDADSFAMQTPEEHIDDDGNLAAALAALERSGSSRLGTRGRSGPSRLVARGQSSLRRHGHVDVDVDRMSYEELLALGDRIGHVQRAGPTNEELARLPTRCVEASSASESHGPAEVTRQCSVCYDDYAAGDELRTLPCLHSFHKDCIDKWFTSGMPGARTCPVCNSEVQFDR